MASTKKVVWAALVGNGLIAAMKFGVFGFVGSPALLAEAFHSVADTVNQGFLLLSLKFQKRQPTERHPFGFGMERFFWAFLAAVFIFGVGSIESFRHGLHAWAHPEPVSDPGLAYIVLGLALLFEAGSLAVALSGVLALGRKMKMNPLLALIRSKDATLKTTVGEDLAALIGLLLAGGGLFMAQLTGNPRWDSGATILIGFVLAAVALGLAKESRSLLLGQGADPEEREHIRQIIESDPAVEQLSELLTMYLCPDSMLVTVHLSAVPGLSADALARKIDDIEARIRDAVPAARRIFIEVQPADHPSLNAAS